MVSSKSGIIDDRVKVSDHFSIKSGIVDEKVNVPLFLVEIGSLREK